MPLSWEAARALRAADLGEAVAIARAWGAVRVVLVTNPRVSKARLDFTELKESVPELFMRDHPWEGPA